MNDADKRQLDELHPVQQVLRYLVISLGAMNPQAMPKVAHMLRAATASDGLSDVARVMLWDLADGIDGATQVDTEH